MRALTVALILLLLSVIPASAQVAAPTTIAIHEAYAWGGTLEDGDMLFMARYQVSYGTNPSAAINSNYITSFYNASSTPIATDAPVVFTNDGYGDGLFAFYFTAAQVASSTLVWNTALGMSIRGNPTQFVTVPSSGIFTSINWVDQNITETSLGISVMRRLSTLQQTATFASIALVQSTPSGTRLTANGELYIDLVVTSMRLMAPNMYTATLAEVFTDTRTFTTTTTEGLLEDTPIDEAFEAAADAWNVPEVAIRILFAMSLSTVIAGVMMTTRHLDINWTATSWVVSMLGLTVVGIIGQSVIAMIATAAAVFALWLIFKPG